ncbi:hypothetical protein EG327_009115 [Venturia inaequalis]|uniref:Uncharacterized protein n=1 Tax=Venturia inaequalis TaxID=5025 RepID=A0A8H3UPY5_VENIN|nr:hypothetical protein EG327_009115 [Venturia inaequalis]
MTTTQEKHHTATSQLRRSGSDEWSIIDGQYMSDMLNYNMVDKDNSFHEGLALRTKVDSAVGPRSPEVAMAVLEEPNIKTEDSDGCSDGPWNYRLPTVEDEYTDQMSNHAEDLRNALNATDMAEVEDQEQEDLIDLVSYCEELEPFPNTASPTPKSRHNILQYTPKTRFDADVFLHKIKARFTSHPGIYTAFVLVLKAYQAAPSPGPIRQTHDAVRKLFWPHGDLIRGFEEWLPHPVGDEQVMIALEPVAFEERGVALEIKGVELEKGAGGCGRGGGGGEGGNGTVDEGVLSIEREIAGLKAGVEWRGLRERVRRIDGCADGPGWVVEQLEKDVQMLKGENEMMSMEIDGLVE